MPRDAGGNYTLPAGNPVVTGTTITSSWANPTMADIASEITNSLSRNGQGGMLVAFEFFDGTQNDPGITFSNEPTLGIFRSSAGVLGVGGQGKSIALFKGATGNVEIDGTAPVDAADLTRKDYVDAADAVLQAAIDAGGGTASLGLVPIGGIIMYNGSFAAIPANYQLCDGTGITPDMTDRFVYGTITEGELRDIGGSDDAVSISHTHTLDTAPNHQHSTGIAQTSSSTGSGGASGDPGNQIGPITGGAGAHSHVVSTDGATGTNLNRPAFLKLAYIQRMT